jgi:ribosomal protein S18 acetylase RimI-like enzyme
MAVLADFQKKGIGDQLLQHVIATETENKTELIWFNARENAVPFYEKLDFHIRGTAFEIEGVGTHFLMYRFL